MTKENGSDIGDAEVLDTLAAALTETGELLPTDEDEVRAAEESGVEDVQLPAHLERFSRSVQSPASKHAPATDLAAYGKRRGWMTHGATLAIGAAAGVALMLQISERKGGYLPSGDPAGSTTASSGLNACSSGRRCIPCNVETLVATRYRLRVGGVQPAEFGREALERYPTSEPEICLRAGASKEVCVPTQITDRPGGRWIDLPMVASAEDLAAGLAASLRWKGVKGPLATAGRWMMPVALTPKSLCNGYAIKLMNEDKNEPFGTMSLFLDDTYYVELATDSTTAPLRSFSEALELSGVVVQLQQTKAMFALTAGPFDLETAEQLRWQLLEQKQEAKLTLGLDYIGAAKPLP
jgi:hypothetical protein